MSDLALVFERNIQKGGFVDAERHETTAVMSITGLNEQTLPIGTAVQSVYTANIGTLGFAFARSLVTSTATTATIEIGRLDGTSLFSFCRLKPDEAALLRLAPGNYAAKADAAGARLFISIAEE